ncbi:MAG: CBS domain-containing protein [Proteobacteria bacterium]|nr:CBS domain-containing protein [Pseudomonadota bacterium]
MTTVKEMLDIKGREVWSIEASRSVYQAIEMMEGKEVGALTVLDNNACLAGIISERDFARKVILKDRSAHETSVADIMTTDVVVIDEDTTVDKCMSLMSQKKIRHLPVMDGETPVGMITVGDLLKVTIKEQSTTIEELESYIMDETGGEG